MKRPATSLLLHPLLLISLFVLLINDWYWKPQFANEVTGKLSDVAGLIALAIFLFHFFPAGKKWVLVGIALFFVWWKSAWSSPVISFFNEYLHLPVHRVIDYSDLLALLPLPLLLRLQPVVYNRHFWQRAATCCIILIACFSFTATSMIRHLTDDNREDLEKYIHVKKTEAEIIAALQSGGIPVQAGPPIYEKIWRSRYYLRPKDSTQQMIMIPVDSLYTGVYQRVDYGSTYTIPKLPWGKDTLHNLQLIISKHNKRKHEIRLHSFERRGVVAESNYPGQLFQIRKSDG